MGLEAVSRGMDHATLVDNNKGAISVIKENVKNLKADKETKIICGNIFTVLELTNIKIWCGIYWSSLRKAGKWKIDSEVRWFRYGKIDGVIVVESLEEEVWPERDRFFYKI